MKVSEVCLDGADLQFYKYNGELKDLLDQVRSACSSCNSYHGQAAACGSFKLAE